MTLACAAVVFTILLAALAAYVRNQNQPICNTTPRLIATDPDFFTGQTVRLKVSGMEPFTDPQGNRELRFREATDKPFIIIVRGKVPEKVPETLICQCEGPKPGGFTLLVVH